MINMVAEFSISDFIGIKQLLNSSNEDDVVVGLENIKNIQPDPIYILLLAKVSPKETRDKILNNLHDVLLTKKYEAYTKVISRRWGGDVSVKDLSWENLHNTIVNYHKDDKNLVDIFTTQFQNEMSSVIMSVSNYSFLDELKFKIKW